MIDLRERSLESLRKGDSAAAYAGYLRLLREDPGNADNDFMLGQVAFAQGKYPMAVFAYLRVIKASPGHERARLELARTYAQMGQLELSRAELAALRAIKPDLPPADEMEKSLFPAPYSPWTIQATLGAGLFYDSNANTGTSASEYLGYSLEDGRQRESFGAYFSGGLDVAYRLSKETNWYLVGDVSATNRQYFNASVDSRLTWGRAALGLRWASDKVLAEIRGKGEYLGRANSEVTQNVGAEAAFMYALTENWTLVTQSAYEYRHYAFDYKAMRGTHGQVGQYVRYQFGESRHELLLGGVYFIDRAHEKRYDGQGAEVLGRIVFHLPWQVKAGVFAAWHSAWYDAPPTDMGGAKRREEQFKGGLELEKGITKGLSVNAQAQYTKNFSNHALYRYDQWLLTTGLTYKF
ncbi:MAG: tetratricopeptide repeat protein, partial [Deltaproteobacteria bacterium]|jgi:tetratricopeptide (TPR) repeat protein|nr:tetratricopeptide repeat protein [Deltaproteobacteria bacterium]